MEQKKINRVLSFQLTDEELDAKVKKLVEITNVKIPILENTKTLAMKRYKNEIEELQNEAFKLGDIYTKKCEDRECECFLRYNPKTNQMDLIRTKLESTALNGIYNLDIFEMKANPEKKWEDQDFYYKSAVVESRDLTADEKQLQLDLKEKEEIKIDINIKEKKEKKSK